MTNYNWIYPPTDQTKSNNLAEQLKISHVTAQILINRGITDLQTARTFFKSPLKELNNPFLMKDMEKAVKKIVSVLEEIVSRQQQDAIPSLITIYGDYDVDGTTGTALLKTFFKEIGVNVQYYIPDRQSEGYGINIEAIRKIASSGACLIISVDCGMSSYDEIVEAKNLGVEVIITDHHQVPEKIPPAYAVLNPSQLDCPYPYKKLSGVGVAFKLLTAIRNKLRDNADFANRLPNLKKHLDLAALGTIADLAPITGENRILAYHGLQELTCTQKSGLAALKKAAGCLNKDIETADVGFLLGPRINAAGRLKTADSGVKLLISENTEEAEIIAKSLDETNRKRQNIQKEIFNEAVELIDSNPYLKDSYTTVLASENWHQGVLGVVASKLLSKYYKPTILISLNGSMGKASGRSIEGFNLYKSVSKCGSLLKKYGGHEMAVGFSIEKDMIEEFKKTFEEETRNSIKDPKIFISPLKIDTIVFIDEISKDLCKEIEMLAPFGFGNSRPVLAAKNVSLPFPPNIVGKNGDHLKMRIKGNKKTVDAIGFNMGGLISKFDFEVDRFDIAFTLSINSWNDKKILQLKLKDICLTEEQ